MNEGGRGLFPWEEEPYARPGTEAVEEAPPTTVAGADDRTGAASDATRPDERTDAAGEATDAAAAGAEKAPGVQDAAVAQDDAARMQQDAAAAEAVVGTGAAAETEGAAAGAARDAAAEVAAPAAAARSQAAAAQGGPTGERPRRPDAPQRPLVRKEYYSISEVADIVGLPAHVLRYWESQFSVLNPSKNRSGNRVYQRKEIKLILLVKQLLHDEKYTVEGAKQKLEQLRRAGGAGPAAQRALDEQLVHVLREELLAVSRLLSTDGV